MKILCYLLIFLAVFLLIWHFLTKKYLNPYKLIIVIGPKGSGKTSDLTKRAIKAINKGQTVYCTESIPGTYTINAKEDIGIYEFEPNSLVLVDERGMVWNRRKYKDFPDYVRNWAKLQRHYKLNVVLYSQDSDIDLTLRTLADSMYILDKFGRVFSVGKGIYKKIVLTESTADTTANVRHNLDYMPLLTPNSRTFTFIPKYAGVFDSYIAPKLKQKEFEYNPIPSECKHLFKGHFRLIGDDTQDTYIEGCSMLTNDSGVK